MRPAGFNGAALFRARSASASAKSNRGIGGLQRSRALSSTECPCKKSAPCVRKTASTEPRSFEHGVRGARSERRMEVARFNGAALFRARSALGRKNFYENHHQLQRSRALSSTECASGQHLRPRSSRASTEPRSFEHGVLATQFPADAQTIASTEPRSFEHGVAPLGPRDALIFNASTEPRSFEHGVAGELRQGCTSGKASTEPRSFEHGVRNNHAETTTRRAASTEPRSFEHGVRPLPKLPKNSARLQRSRALSSTECLSP